MTSFDTRAKSTQATLDELAKQLSDNLGADAERILRNDTSIYVVGSGGRGEMSEHSDVDLFVARVGRSTSDVDAFLVRQAIARTLYAMKRPDPSQGGAFLKMHTDASLCDRMGTAEDDAENTFTARMLLLLESQALLGEAAYAELLDRVLEAYWKDAATHASDYHPYVLVNDVVRYWRSLLLNYVAKNAKKAKELRAPERRHGERELRSYKLRFSRCLSCFSVLAALLVLTGRGGVRKDDVRALVRRRPIERLRDIGEARAGTEAAAYVDKLLALYDGFLTTTNAPTKDLEAKFGAIEFTKAKLDEGYAFGDAMFDLLQVLGREGRARNLFRYMVV